MGSHGGGVMDNIVFSGGGLDPFGGDDVDGGGGVGGNGGEVHIRVQQRNGRKCICTVQGLAADLDMKKILKYIKKENNCNGAVIEDKVSGNVLQFQGDQRKCVKEFLVREKICNADEVKVHGF